MDTPENKRSQRQKTDKHGRGAALERLKQLKEKGVKHKYEVKDLENVYDTVDQKEYEQKVWQRQDEDWIVDDDGSGYVEDGREIFDDDLDAESIEAARKDKGKKKKISRNVDTPVTGKGSIQTMFSSMPNKKSKKEHNINEDDLLNDLLGEIKTISTSKLPIKKTSTVTKFQELTSSPKIVIRDDSPPRITKIKANETQSKQMDSPIISTTSQSQSQDSAIIEDVESMDLDETKDALPKIEQINSQEEDMTILEAAFDDDDMQMDTDLINAVSGVETNKMRSNDKENLDLNGQTAKIDTKTKDIFSDDKFFTEWEENQMKQQQENHKNLDQQSETDTNNSMDSLMVENSHGEKILRFFWWDAHEIQSKPGNVFLFGKIFLKSSNSWVSCCVQVENIERKLYVLPRKYHYDMRSNTFTDEEVTMIDVYNEFNKKFAKGHQFRSKPTNKFYCFDVQDVPTEAEYLEVRYPADGGRIPKENMAGETIQHIFGTDTNFLEIFLLDRKIKGPCWLDIEGAELCENKQISWCKMEYRCNMRNVTITNMELAPPPLVLAALTIRTTLNPSTNQTEIVMISCLTHSKYEIHKSAPEPMYENHFCVLSRPTGVSWSFDHLELFKTYKATKVQKCDSERALLNYFLTQFLKNDADLIIGHDLVGYQLDVLFHRLSVLKIGNWSLFGKLRLKTMPQRVKNIQQDLCAGRLVCDLKISAKELIKSRSYDLPTLCSNILKMDDTAACYELEQDEIRNFYEVSNGLRKLIAWTMRDTSCILKMVYELNALPLAVQITNITGFILSKTLLGGRSERNEYLLLHAFTENNYIVPDKYKQVMVDDFEQNVATTDTSKVGKKKPQYAGGLVLEPKVGFYNTYILLMDFNSLYPSIIQEYNICFTEPTDPKTKTTGSEPLGGDDGFVVNEGLRFTPGADNVEMRILPKEIKKLVDSRREVKTLMKKVDVSSDLYMKYNIKQLALKLTANSMYGCLGYSKSRFYAQRLASKITELGREILQNTQVLVKQLCYEVIYGDTDSLMINTNIRDYEQVFKIGIKIKREVNQHYKQIELDIDGVFQYLLLLKKKKYAARIVSKDKRGNLVYQQEIKGLDIVRRDWCQLAAKTGKYILDNLLCDHDEDTRMKAIFTHLTTLRVKLEQNEIPITDLAITKQLTKAPGAYADMKALPHVQVAVRYNLIHAKRLRQGDMVSYVICDDGTDRQAMQRGYHIDELKTNTKLKIDIKYYLLQQVFPLVNRLCEPIDYIQSEQIANCLGLEGLTFKQVLKPNDKTQISDSDGCSTSTANKNLFIGAKSFIFKCVSCRPLITCQLQEAYDVLKETVTSYMNDSEHFYVSIGQIFTKFDEHITLQTRLPTFKEDGTQDDDDDEHGF
ncbi:DNA polymerase alpha catalytic subunit [Chrysoperla carnea]|uniref:DNA polymerase alpha catalytic subunit n=1 Tax=Chrysoperla carnea TaxID=189513 RepID=UPI001D09867C|nr:DNA polymerase alpha catalytic subunit [Chrysoperla carnea]